MQQKVKIRSAARAIGGGCGAVGEFRFVLARVCMFQSSKFKRSPAQDLAL
jgi:hypothetical protein